MNPREGADGARKEDTVTETPWTPGPWSVRTDGTSSGRGPVVYVAGEYYDDGSELEIAEVGITEVNERTMGDPADNWIRQENASELEANARLIAAAPELVAALEGTVSWCPMCAGTGRYTPYCVRCEDSTDDHYCPSSKPCFQCRDARALLARVRGEEIQG